MQRREAILLFREICNSLQDASIFSCVSLRKRDEPADFAQENYELHIKPVPDESALQQVKAIVAMRQLLMKEVDGAIMIYTSERRLAEITDPTATEITA